MPVVFEWMLCSRPDVDSHRFADTIESAIEEGERPALRTSACESESVGDRRSYAYVCVCVCVCVRVLDESD
jgi:hypothetical protein